MYLRVLLAGLTIFGGIALSYFLVGNHPESQILLLPRTLSNEFHSLIVDGARTAAKSIDRKMSVFAPLDEGDFAFQHQRLLLALQHPEYIGGVVLTPNHSGRAIQSLEELERRSIPYVIVDTAVDFSGTKLKPRFYCGFVSTDNVRGGRVAAEYIGKKLGSGNVILIQGLNGQQSSVDRELGFTRTMREKFPLIKVSHRLQGFWRAEATEKALASLSSKEVRKVKAIFAYNDLMAIGASHYFLKRGLRRPLIVGFDGLLAAQKAIIENRIDATITQNPELMGKLAVLRLESCIKTKQFLGSKFEIQLALLQLARTLSISETGQ